MAGPIGFSFSLYIHSSYSSYEECLITGVIKRHCVRLVSYVIFNFNKNNTHVKVACMSQGIYICTSSLASRLTTVRLDAYIFCQHILGVVTLVWYADETCACGSISTL